MRLERNWPNLNENTQSPAEPAEEMEIYYTPILTRYK